jgi:hypothetical protein
MLFDLPVNIRLSDMKVYAYYDSTKNCVKK